MKVNAQKDGNGNIIITEDSFEMLLACLDNQKFVGELPQNGDSLAEGKENYESTQQQIQKTIDEFNRECRKILHQKLIFEKTEDDYYISKKFEYQKTSLKWTTDDVNKVKELFKSESFKYKIDFDSVYGKLNNYLENIKPETWLIERPLGNDYIYLSISENGLKNRPWKDEEIELIKKLFN